MANEQLTFEKLFDVLRTEKSNSALQRLPGTYLSDVVSYLEAKTALVKKDTRLGDYDMATQQLRNIRKVVQEIYDRREKKILMLAISKSRMSESVTDTSTMLEEELQLYTSSVELFSEYRTNILCSLLDHKLPYDGKFTKIVELEADDTTDENGNSEDGPTTATGDNPVETVTVTSGAKNSNDPDAGSSVSPTESEENLASCEITADIPEFMGPDMLMYGPFVVGKQVNLPDSVAKMLIGNGQAKQA